MVSDNKNVLVDHACKELVGQIRSDLKSIYEDIGAQVASKSADTFLSYLSMLEKSKVSAYVNELVIMMRSVFCRVLQQVLDKNGACKYTDSQVTLMWQSIAAQTDPPKLVYMDIRKAQNEFQRELQNNVSSLNEDSGFPILPVVGLGVGVVGLVAAGGVIPAAAACAVRGLSVGVVGVSVYAIWKKKSGAAPVRQAERNVDSRIITKLANVQYAANIEILERWIVSVGEQVKEGEPIL